MVVVHDDREWETEKGDPAPWFLTSAKAITLPSNKLNPFTKEWQDFCGFYNLWVVYIVLGKSSLLFPKLTSSLQSLLLHCLQSKPCLFPLQPGLRGVTAPLVPEGRRGHVFPCSSIFSNFSWEDGDRQQELFVHPFSLTLWGCDAEVQGWDTCKLSWILLLYQENARAWEGVLFSLPHLLSPACSQGEAYISKMVAQFL